MLHRLVSVCGQVSALHKNSDPQATDTVVSAALRAALRLV